MFVDIDSFNIFFFPCLAVILLGIVFENRLVAFENKKTKKRKDSKNEIR